MVTNYFSPSWGFPRVCGGEMEPRQDQVQHEQENRRRKKGSVKIIDWEAILDEELRKYSIDSQENIGTGTFYTPHPSFCQF